jgi:hypothetical protein
MMLENMTALLPIFIVDDKGWGEPYIENYE